MEVQLGRPSPHIVVVFTVHGTAIQSSRDLLPSSLLDREAKLDLSAIVPLSRVRLYRSAAGALSRMSKSSATHIRAGLS